MCSDVISTDVASEPKEVEEATGDLPEQEASDGTSERSDHDQRKPAEVLLGILGPAYASPSCPTAVFYLETIGIILLAALTAVCSLAYNNIFYITSSKWMTNDVEKLGVFFGGEPYWIAIGAGTGIVVGVLKAYVFKFDTYSGFIELVQDLDADIKEAISMAVVGLVSLIGGASLGPESGLAGVGGLLGKLSVKPINAVCRRALGNAVADDHVITETETKRSKLLVLSAIVSAFATMLPTPASSVMFCIELMGARRFVEQGFVSKYTGTIVQLGLAGTVSNLVYTAVEGYTLIKVAPEIPGYNHTTLIWKNTGVAILFGLATPFVLAIPYFAFAGIGKFMRVKLKAKFDAKFGDKVRIVLMATIGGTIFGIVGYILPLTPGDGAYQMPVVIQNGYEIDSSVLVVSAYGKMFSYWISTEFGFVGGIFHPILMISLLFGRMVINVTNMSELLGSALSFIMLAAALTPLPFSMFLLDVALFNLKASDQVSVFLAIVIVHLMTTGIGFPQKFLSFALSRGHDKKNEMNCSIRGGSDASEKDSSKA